MKQTETKRLSKEDIHQPNGLNFIGINSEQCDEAERKMIDFLAKAGISGKQLQDKETKDFICEFLKIHDPKNALNVEDSNKAQCAPSPATRMSISSPRNPPQPPVSLHRKKKPSVNNGEVFGQSASMPETLLLEIQNRKTFPRNKESNISKDKESHVKDEAIPIYENVTIVKKQVDSELAENTLEQDIMMLKNNIEKLRDLRDDINENVYPELRLRIDILLKTVDYCGTEIIKMESKLENIILKSKMHEKKDQNIINKTPILNTNASDSNIKTTSRPNSSNSRRKLTTADIGLPKDFRHVARVGWDEKKGFDILEKDVDRFFRKTPPSTLENVSSRNTAHRTFAEETVTIAPVENIPMPIPPLRLQSQAPSPPTRVPPIPPTNRYKQTPAAPHVDTMPSIPKIDYE